MTQQYIVGEFSSLLAERRDLLLLLLGELARALPAGELLALHVMPDVLDDLGVRERCRVADVGEVGDRGDHPAHDLARAGLRHVRDDPHVLRARDLPDLLIDRVADLLLDFLARAEPRLERAVHLHDLAAELVNHRDRGGLGDLLDGAARRLDLLRAQPVPGDIDHVVDPAEDPEVAVGRLNGAVAREVRPIVPVLAVLVPVVLRVISVDVSLGLAPDRLEAAWPRVADADVARLAAPRPDDLTELVVDDRVDAKHARPAAARLHRLQPG